MDIREPVAKMRAEAEKSRDAEAALRNSAQRVMADAQAEYERIAAEAQKKFNEISERADAAAAEAAYWFGLAEREERAAALPSVTETLTDTPEVTRDA